MNRLAPPKPVTPAPAKPCPAPYLHGLGGPGCPYCFKKGQR